MNEPNLGSDDHRYSAQLSSRRTTVRYATQQKHKVLLIYSQHSLKPSRTKLGIMGIKDSSHRIVHHPLFSSPALPLGLTAFSLLLLVLVLQSVPGPIRGMYWFSIPEGSTGSSRMLGGVMGWCSKSLAASTTDMTQLTYSVDEFANCTYAPLSENPFLADKIDSGRALTVRIMLPLGKSLCACLARRDTGQLRRSLLLVHHHPRRVGCIMRSRPGGIRHQEHGLDNAPPILRCRRSLCTMYQSIQQRSLLVGFWIGQPSIPNNQAQGRRGCQKRSSFGSVGHLLHSMIT